MTCSEQHLFVYGTLAPGRSNEHVLAEVAGRWARGTVRGRLLDEGWGAALGYPALRLDPEGVPVEGFVLSSLALHEHWDRLDAFEGEGYVRMEVEVTSEDGLLLLAQVYTARPGGAGRQR